MPLLLREGATYWTGGLENNDVKIHVTTPESQMKVQEYGSKREEDQAARAFSRKTEFSWEAFIYFLDPAHKNDRGYIQSAMSDYHIHMFAKLILGQGLRIDRLLPKNGDAKGQHRLDLIGHPLAGWDSLVAHMSPRTAIAVSRFRVFYVEWHMLKYEIA